MSLRRFIFPRPGPGRITLVLLAVVPAVMAYPWSSTRDRWVLGVGVAVLIVLLGGWRGLHFTTILRRRAAMLRPRRGVHADPRSGSDVRTTALLRVVPPSTDPDVLPLPLIAGYLHRYGLRADTVRVTSRDTRSGADVARRDTWIGLTFSASANLAALQARSPLIPLQETAEVAARRLADHLRETGWETTPAGLDDVPELFGATAQETWRAFIDGAADHVAAYQVSVDHSLSETLARIWSLDARETWTAVEVAGDGEHRTLAAACALRTDDRPAGAGPLPGLTPQHGYQRPALLALHPLSSARLAGHTEFAAGDFTALHWPTALEPQPDARQVSAN
ncbi:MAG TPA: type VII secretion protein EccE [Mycobacterium sp.]|nr:type VII secretion protein EccE [Mycobacterium sp.]